MGVGIDKSRQQQLAGHIDELRIGRVNMGCHRYDFFAVHQHIGIGYAAAADHTATGKESFHRKASLCHIFFSL